MVSSKLIRQLLSASIKEQKAPIQTIKANSDLEEYGFDSLAFIRFIMLLEEKLHISILEEDLLYKNFSTIEKIQELLEKYNMDEE